MDANLFTKEKTMKKYVTLENRIRDVVRKSRKGLFEQRSKIEKDQADQIAAGTYRTKNFEMCPRAQLLFVNLPHNVNPDLAEKMAILHDQLFGIKKHTLATERSTSEDSKEANQIVDKIRMLGDQMGVSDKLGYLDKHLGDIKGYEQSDSGPVDKITPDIMKRLRTPPTTPQAGPKDTDIDSSKFVLSRNLKAQRKLKIIDAD
jgi:hypothetical protein